MPDEPDPDYDPNSATIPLSGPRPTLSGSNVDLPLPEELAKLLPAGAYEISGFLGAGGMGAVYKGMQIRLKRPVAIKIMRRDMGKDHDFEARFEREAQAMAKLNHPNIISVIDFGEAGPDYLFIVMELVDGTDLMDVIRSKQMTQEMALTLLPQICDALQFAHDHGIVHRDIKPSNIMLTRDGRVKMADFGLAKHFDHAESGFRTQTGTGMGTPDYAAPEQFDPTTPVDHRADIYALGVMIYQMITGALPRGVWRPPSQRASVSSQWDAVVSRAMQNDPSERYQKASEVKTELSSIPLASKEGSAGTPARTASSGGAAAKNQEADKSVRAPVKSRAPLLFGLVIGAVVIAAGAFLILREPSPRSGGLQPPSQAAAITSGSSPTPSSAPQTLTPAVQNTPLLAQPLPESGWKPLFTEEEWRTSKGNEREFKDGLVHLREGGWRKSQPSPDGAIRARIQLRTDSKGAAVTIRHRKDEGRYSLGAAPDGKSAYLHRFDGPSKSTTLATYWLPKPPQSGDTITLELRIRGEHLTGIVNGKVIGEVTDAQIKGPDEWGVGAVNAWFESVEVQPLGAAAAIIATSEPTMIKLWDSPEKLPKKPGVTWENGAMRIDSGSVDQLTPRTRDAIARVSVRMNPDSKRPELWLRKQSAFNTGYKVGLDVQDRRVALKSANNGIETILIRWQLPRSYAPDEWLKLEFRAVGDTLTASADGTVLGTVHDTSRSQPGNMMLYAEANGFFRDIEYVPLDKPAADASSVSPTPNLPVSKSSDPKFPSGQWVKLFTKYEELPENLRQAQLKIEEGWIRCSLSETGRGLLLPPFTNGGVRARFRVGSAADPTHTKSRIYLRETVAGQSYSQGIIPGKLMCQRREGDRFTKVFETPLPQPVGDGYQLEFGVVGSRLVGRTNNQVFSTAQDTTFQGRKNVIQAYEDVTDIEVINLDGLPEAEALRLMGVDEKGNDLRGKSGAASTSATPAASAVLNFGGHRYQFVPSNMKWSEAKVKAAEMGGHLAAFGSSEEWETVRSRILEKVQAHAVWLGGYRDASNQWKWTTGEPWSFTSWAKKKNGESEPSNSNTPGGPENCLEARMDPTALRHYDWNDMVDRAPTHNLSTGFLVEWDDSVGVPASSASATKDAPFTNTLGMKFVPVPITGGPTDQQRVLFSVWETRVQDYEAFVKETKREWPKPDFEQGPTHPAVNVSRDDAMAFCMWLTERERKAGKLGAKEAYRLPSDHEWSCAAGIGERESAEASPDEKSEKLAGVYFWGSQWPPPRGAGNFAGSEAQITQVRNDGRYLSLDDGYTYTSPVGAYPAEQNGLFDLAGNVVELCAEQIRGSSVQRGGQYSNYYPETLLSSHRGLKSLGERNVMVGFRIVFVPVEPATEQGSGSDSSTATKEAPFTNTLGMKFVPVPITGGPTDKQRVLFSVWETRVQDYEAFVKETKREWPKADFPYGPTHPAVNVTRDDAQSFCTWLTEKEHLAGRLGATERYRLPADHEWSCAVGIGTRENPAQTPSEKSGKVADVFPWGTTWPPPSGAGNLGGGETTGTLPSKAPNCIESYRDDFLQTASVGSFSANVFGLFDLCGNVWELCSEPWESGVDPDYVARGGSWGFAPMPSTLLSSNRNHGNNCRTTVGFRVVLTPATPTP